MRQKIAVLFVVFVILGFSSLAYSQQQNKKELAEKAEPATKLEQFLSKKGRLYLKDFSDAGSVSGQYGTNISIKALIVYEPGKEIEKLRGLKVEVYEGGRLEKSNTSFLDIDEAESLSKAIDYMVNLFNKFKDTNREYTEVIFSTKGDFKVGFYQKGSSFTAFASSGYIRETSCFLPIESLGQLKAVIDKGIMLAKKNV
jgi:hypothetical protein